MSLPPLGNEPVNVTCPSCKATGLTRIQPKATIITHAVAIGLCLLLCWPCICLPYCINIGMNSDHHCSSCNAYLGTYRRT